MGHSQNKETTIFIHDYHGPGVWELLRHAERVHHHEDTMDPKCTNYWIIDTGSLKNYLEMKGLGRDGGAVYNGGKDPIIEIKKHNPDHST